MDSSEVTLDFFKANGVLSPDVVLVGGLELGEFHHEHTEGEDVSLEHIIVDLGVLLGERFHLNRGQVAIVLLREGLDQRVGMLADHSIVPYLEFTFGVHSDVVGIDVSMEELLFLPLGKKARKATKDVPEFVLFKSVVVLSSPPDLILEREFEVVDDEGD
jgi:hypothetical protein